MTSGAIAANLGGKAARAKNRLFSRPFAFADGIKMRKKPHATARCDDCEFTGRLRGEGHAGSRTGLGEGYRPVGRQALAGIIETEMAAAVDRRLESLAGAETADRRNG